MVANFDPTKRQPIPTLALADVPSSVHPTSVVDLLAAIKRSLAKQSLIDQLDALMRQLPDFLGSGCRLSLPPAAFSAYAVWALDWVIADDRHRGYTADFVAMSFTVSFGGRPLLIVERAVTA